MKTVYLSTPLDPQKTADLRKGDIVYLSGVIYTARDAAHKKLLEHYRDTGEMPLAGEVIYHAGPCPKGKGVIGSIGPTTSCRMDTYAAGFAGAGVKYSIGKGNRGQDAAKAIAEAGGAHFDAVGGAGAFYMRKVKKAEIFLYPELGAEAVWRLEVEDFPVIVSII